MKTLPKLLTLTGFLFGSYTTFHGHRLNKDCRLCNYRGLGWILAVGVIVWADYQEKQVPAPSTSYRSYPPRDYSHDDTSWENTSEVGSDDSNATEKPNQ